MCGKMRTLHSIWRVPVTCAGDGAGNQTHSLTHTPAPFSGEGRLPLTLRSPFQGKVVFPSRSGSLFRERSSSPHTPVPFSGEGRLPFTLRLPFQGKVVFPSHPGPLFRGRSSSPHTPVPFSGEGRLPVGALRAAASKPASAHQKRAVGFLARMHGLARCRSQRPYGSARRLRKRAQGVN